MYDLDLPYDANDVQLVEAEESNNPARTWWDETYGGQEKRLPAGHGK